MLTVEFHPQRERIVAMICDTSTKWSSKDIGEAIDPPMSMSAIAKFRRRLVGHHANFIQPRSSKSKEIQAKAAGETVYGNGIESAREDLLARVKKYSLRREKWISDAESQIVRDRDGLPVIDPSTLQPIKTHDHRALSAHDRNNLSALELEGRLTGALLEQSNSTNVQLAIYVPQMDAPSPTPAAPAPAGPIPIQVYDIGKTWS